MLHLFSLLLLDVILVKHFLGLQVDDTHLRVSNHKIAARVVKHFGVLGARKPGLFFVFVEHILQQVYLVFVVTHFENHLLV